MSNPNEKTDELITSDKLHNKNCFNYLRNVKLPNSLLELNRFPPDIASALTSLHNHELHIVNELPDDLTSYKGGYVYCDNDEGRKLYFIQSNGKAEEVKIKDFSLFIQNLKDINNKNAKQLRLDDGQVESLITSNGGHIPYDLSYPYADLYSKFFGHLEENITKIYDVPRQKMHQDAEDIKEYLKTPEKEWGELSEIEKFNRRTIKRIKGNILPSLAEINNKQGCDLHLMSELPEDLTQYKWSYIYCNDSEGKKLYFIQGNGQPKEVNINDFSIIDDYIRVHKQEDSNQLFLTNTQVKDLINLNGGHSFSDEALKYKVRRLEEEVEALDEFIYSLYANDNHILEDTFANIKEITRRHTPSSPGIKGAISRHVKDKGESINRESYSPADEETTVRKVSAFLSDTYKSQHGTSLSTIRHYGSNQDGPIEYRFGTQGQRHEGNARVSPLFERFLRVEAQRNEVQRKQAKAQGTTEEIDDDPITHIYFNLLGRDREDMEGKKEKALTEQLEGLEYQLHEDGSETGHKNIAVITLPADKGIMSQHAYESTASKHKINDVKNDFLRIAQELPDLHLMRELPKDLTVYKGNYIYLDNGQSKKLFYVQTNAEAKEVNIKDFSQFDRNIASINPFGSTPIRLNNEHVKKFITENGGFSPPFELKDFHISERVRTKIFGDKNRRFSPEVESRILNDLLEKSFEELGYSDKEELSDAERQAVWFHFIKYQLTNYIIDSLTPKSINFSCKDAIDRGGVASAYYNLIKSFTKEEGKVKIPMTREEFDQALHAAPTMVKGRGMNHHLNLIWNAVDAYVNKNYESLKKESGQQWLIEWRDLNCPHERVKGLLERRVDECKRELEEKHRENPSDLLVKKGLDVITEIQNQTSQGVSGKRLLLETAIRTTSMALNRDQLSEEDLAHNCERYKELHNKLSIYPGLHILGGLMKSFAGAIVYALTRGKVDILSSGWATFKAGWESDSRAALQRTMDYMKNQLSPPEDPQKGIQGNPDGQSIKQQIEDLKKEEDNSSTLPTIP